MRGLSLNADICVYRTEDSNDHQLREALDFTEEKQDEKAGPGKSRERHFLYDGEVEQGPPRVHGNHG